MKAYRLVFWFALRYLKDGASEVGFVARIALLGIVVGVSVLVIVLSVINGFQRELQLNVLSNLPQAQVLLADGLSKTDISTLGDLRESGLVASAPFINRSGLVVATDRVSGASINGIQVENYQSVSSVFEYLVEGEGRSLGKNKFSVVIGSRMARTLDISVGNQVTLVLPDQKLGLTGSIFRRKRFTVIDIFDTGTLQDSSHVYISLRDAKLLFQSKRAQGLHGRLQDLFDSSLLWPYFSSRFGERVYSISTWFTSNGNLYRAIAVQKMTMFVLLFFLVGVAAFNLVSGMVMIVEHRKGDIAILMSMGASSRFLASLFCLIGVMLCLLGTLLGITLGVGVASALPSIYEAVSSRFGLNLMSEYFISYLPVDILAADLSWVFLITMLIGLLASSYPAFRASSLFPSQVLAHE